MSSIRYTPECIESENCRFVLKQNGKNPLVVLGLNPSTTDANDSDTTMRRIMGYVERNGFDSFIMLNLYPQRATNSNLLDLELDEGKHMANLDMMKKVLDGMSKPTILLAYGDKIRVRRYLRHCLKDIIAVLERYDPSYVKIGAMTNAGNPRHPSRGPYYELTDLNINVIR
ncbi:MAG: DUF1643 domain-containing protein [Bacteroidaceae bacterium]|nr:DUF1643 domain-containing protein [Bacteroidaceae bacterium]